MKARLSLIAALLLAIRAEVALAHARPDGSGPRTWHELAHAWEWDPFVVLGLVVTAALYGIGVRRLWKSAGRGRGITTREACAFAGGCLTLAVALLSPLHPWGQVLFAAHMTQHELLMLLAAPLLVLGRPLLPSLWALPIEARRTLGSLTRVRWLANFWQFLTRPFTAFVIHAVALWIWHVPALFQATLTSDLVHTAQHLSFLLSAILFWWAILHSAKGARGFGLGVLSLFTTSVHSGALGALLTFGTKVWYPAYAAGAPAWGLSPLEDQQLGGLIMWIPAGFLYLFAALILAGHWIASADRARPALRLGGIA